MTVEKLYVCDGAAEGCARENCKFEGNGECMHTTNWAHARYEPPREWTHIEEPDRTIWVEKER